MATIKFKRGSGVPTGLTAYEAAWDTSLGRFFIHNGSTATWIGARIDSSTSLGGAGVCAYYVPTQLAVKTYVDNQVAGGAVSSVNGLTGAVTGVAFLNTAQTFTQLQSFSAGLSASGGATLAGTVNLTGSLLATSNVRGSTLIAFNSWPGYVGFDGFGNYGSNRITFTFDSTGVNERQSLIPADLPSIGAGAHSIIQLPNDSGTIALTKTTVGSINGVTGTLTLGVGSGLSVASSPSAKGITLTNIGVLAIQAGTGLSSSGQTGNVTITNTGVTGVTGTANQVSVSATTGSVTLSLPSAITTPGSLTTTTSLSVGTDLTVTGNLTVNGTTTTVNSNTVTINDPVIAIGGVGTTNAPPPNGDVKDRGIIFQWNSGSAGATGFFGHDQSAVRFTYIPSGLSVTGDVVSGAVGSANFSGVYAPQGILTLQGTSAASATILLSGNTTNASTTIDYTANEHLFKNTATGLARIALQSDLLDPSLKGTITIGSALTAARTYTLPNLTGQVVVAATSPVQNRILLGDVSGSPPNWVDPSTGITANNANNILLTSDNTDPVCFVTFVASGTNGMQSLRYNTGFTYNAVTNYLEVNIDGGGY